MGGPLTPAVANLFIQRLSKPKKYFRYVDDMFVVLKQGTKKLNNFFKHINSIHPNIQFTMEVKTAGKFIFLDVLVARKGDKFGDTVYRRLTRTERDIYTII